MEEKNMNQSIKTVLNNQGATVKEYFELINLFDCSSLRLSKEGELIFSIDFNTFREYKDVFEFSQKFGNAEYTIKKSDVKSFKAKMLEGMDTFHIVAELADGLQMGIFIYHTDTNTKVTEYEHYYEIGVEKLKEYLEDERHKAVMVRIRDVYAFEMKLSGIKEAYVAGDEEGGYSLCITDTLASFDISLVDDSCNEVYLKEGHTDSILIKPYGQPFMNIIIFVIKEEEKKPHLSVIK